MMDVIRRAVVFVLQAALLWVILACLAVSVWAGYQRQKRKHWRQRQDLNGAWRTSPLGRIRILERGGTTAVHFVEPRERDASMRAGGMERA